MARKPAQKDRSRPARRRRRGGTILFGLAVSGALSIIGLWIAVNHVEWLGPYVADGLRAVVGVNAVAALEDFAYRVQDRVNRVWRRGEKPKAYWTVPAAKTRPTPPKAAPPEPSAEPVPEIPPFSPADVGPVHKEWSAPGDGQWVPMADADHPG